MRLVFLLVVVCLLVGSVWGLDKLSEDKLVSEGKLGVKLEKVGFKVVKGDVGLVVLSDHVVVSVVRDNRTWLVFGRV